MLHDFDEINKILNELAEHNILEPIDCDDCSPFDYAEVTGLWEEMYPEPIDANDLVW